MLAAATTSSTPLKLTVGTTIFMNANFRLIESSCKQAAAHSADFMVIMTFAHQLPPNEFSIKYECKKDDDGGGCESKLNYKLLLLLVISDMEMASILLPSGMHPNYGPQMHK